MICDLAGTEPCEPHCAQYLLSQSNHGHELSPSYRPCSCQSSAQPTLPCLASSGQCRSCQGGFGHEEWNENYIASFVFLAPIPFSPLIIFMPCCRNGCPMSLIPGAFCTAVLLGLLRCLSCLVHGCDQLPQGEAAGFHEIVVVPHLAIGSVRYMTCKHNVSPSRRNRFGCCPAAAAITAVHFSLGKALRPACRELRILSQASLRVTLGFPVRSVCFKIALSVKWRLWRPSGCTESPLSPKP